MRIKAVQKNERWFGFLTLLMERYSNSAIKLDSRIVVDTDEFRVWRRQVTDTCALRNKDAHLLGHFGDICNAFIEARVSRKELRPS